MSDRTERIINHYYHDDNGIEVDDIHWVVQQAEKAERMENGILDIVAGMYPSDRGKYEEELLNLIREGENDE